jgi:hypothetical protein
MLSYNRKIQVMDRFSAFLWKKNEKDLFHSPHTAHLNFKLYCILIKRHFNTTVVQNVAFRHYQKSGGSL